MVLSLSGRTRVALLRTAVWTGALIPLAWSVWRFARGDASVNPVEEWLHRSGKTAVILLVLTLAVTPIRRLTGWNGVQKVRRLLGLLAFFYAVVHVGVYLALDQGFGWRYIAEDLTERPFIIAGAIAFLLLLPLALTSTRGWIRRLGRQWVRLHRLIYAAMAAALLHYLWGQKADIRDPLIVAAIVAALLAFRLLRWMHLRAQLRTGPG